MAPVHVDSDDDVVAIARKIFAFALPQSMPAWDDFPRETLPAVVPVRSSRMLLQTKTESSAHSDNARALSFFALKSHRWEVPHWSAACLQNLWGMERWCE